MINLHKILDLLDSQGIYQVTFPANTFVEEYSLPTDDKDYVTFHKSSVAPSVVDKLLVCDYYSTDSHVYKDWYMTINYHA